MTEFAWSPPAAGRSEEEDEEAHVAFHDEVEKVTAKRALGRAFHGFKIREMGSHSFNFRNRNCIEMALNAVVRLIIKLR